MIHDNVAVSDERDVEVIMTLLRDYFEFAWIVRITDPTCRSNNVTAMATCTVASNFSLKFVLQILELMLTILWK